MSDVIARPAFPSDYERLLETRLDAAEQRAELLERRIEAAKRELERASDVRANRTEIIGNAHLLLAEQEKERQRPMTDKELADLGEAFERLGVEWDAEQEKGQR